MFCDRPTVLGLNRFDGGRYSADNRATSYEEKQHLDSDSVVRSVGDSRQTDSRCAFNMPIVGRLSPDCIDCCRRSTDNQPIVAPIKTRPELPFLYFLDVFFFFCETRLTKNHRFNYFLQDAHAY